MVTFYGYDFVVGKSYKANNKMFDDPFGLKNKSGDEISDTEKTNSNEEIDTTGPKTEGDKDKTVKRLSEGYIKPNISILLLIAAALGGFIL